MSSNSIGDKSSAAVSAAKATLAEASESVSETAAAVAEKLDPRAGIETWIKSNPLSSVLSVALGGLVVGLLLFRDRE